MASRLAPLHCCQYPTSHCRDSAAGKATGFVHGVERLDHLQHLGRLADFCIGCAFFLRNRIQCFFEFSAGVSKTANQLNLWLLLAQCFVGRQTVRHIADSHESQTGMPVNGYGHALIDSHKELPVYPAFRSFGRLTCRIYPAVTVLVRPELATGFHQSEFQTG